MSTTKSPVGVITCKAAVLRKAGEPLQVEEIQVDPPKSHEIRIKMLCASICHTDYICCTYDLLPFFPVVHGHEGVGMVESVGDKVTNLKGGDIVVPLYVGECGECQSCWSGKTNLCQKYPVSTSGLMLDGTSRMTSMQGEKVYHHMSCATWSEYTVVEAGYAVKVDPALPLPHASLLACGFTTGFGSTYRVVNIEKGSTVAVLGLGAVGLGVVKGAQMQEAAKIIGIDINDLKAEKARNFGITDFINPKDHCDKAISELVKDATGGFGVDYFFECTGVPSLLNEALEGSKLGFGTAVLLGVGAASVEVKLVPLIYGRTVKGCLYGGVRPHSDLPNIIRKCVNKEINLDELITHEFSLDEINEGFEHMKHPDTIKIVLKF